MRLFGVLIAIAVVALVVQVARGQEEPPIGDVSDSALVVTNATYQGKSIYWWANRAVQNKKDANKRGRTIKVLKRELRKKYEPSFEEYFTVASIAYGVDTQKSRYRKHLVDGLCKVCGKGFKTDKYKPSEHCSYSCRAVTVARIKHGLHIVP